MSVADNTATCLVVPASSVASPAFALDIGGSLVKLAFTSKPCKMSSDVHVRLMTFQANDLDSCLTFIKDNLLSQGHPMPMGHATGVGCVKYQQQIMDTLSVSLTSDSLEMSHATRGLHFLWRHLPAEILLSASSNTADLAFQVDLNKSGLLPCLLVNLGSAMTIVKVDAEGSMREIVGGSTLAGLSLLGLGALLTKAKSFSELVQLASRGDSTKVDLLVRDTAGDHYNNHPQEGLVSSFGRAARARANGEVEDFQEEDVACSLVKAITDNLAAHVFYVARAERLSTVCFCGSYIGGSDIVLQTIVSKLRSASAYLKHEVRPVFLQHEAYLGAIGALASLSPKPTPNSNSRTNGQPS